LESWRLIAHDLDRLNPTPVSTRSAAHESSRYGAFSTSQQAFGSLDIAGAASPQRRRCASLHRRATATLTRETFLKKLSLFGIAIAAALLTAAPVSIQSSSESVVRLALSQAEAQTVVYRRARRPRIYLAPTYYGYYDYGRGYANPYPLFSPWSYGLYPTAYGTAYRVMPWWW
jgi:hypothetical protein